MNMEMVNLGNQLRELREKKGWGTREFARRLRKPHSMISNYENGNAKPTIRVLAEIARELGVNFLDLENFLLGQLPEEQPADTYEVKAVQLELPFEAVSDLWEALEPSRDPEAKITCKRVGTQLVVTAEVKRKRKAAS